MGVGGGAFRRGNKKWKLPLTDFLLYFELFFLLRPFIYLCIYFSFKFTHVNLRQVPSSFKLCVALTSWCNVSIKVQKEPRFRRTVSQSSTEVTDVSVY